ncbi:MAG: hypothetical protein QM772_12435 [Ottowia sp.]|uniref:hypothetical protein n=1 Tax=Ottowia sp. TaxID=1898956 RepID=UPI0039E43D62
MPYTYAFVGLTPSERSLLESIFALEAAEGDDLAQVYKPEDADLLIVNGDDRGVVQRLQADHPGALLVLVGRPSGAEPVDLPVLPRPLDMAGVVRVLSGLDWPHQRRGQPSDFSGTFSPTTVPPTRPPPESQPAAISERDRVAFAPTTASAPLGAGAAVAVRPVSARATWATPERAVSAPVPAAATGDGGVHGLPDDLEADIMVVVGLGGTKHHTLPLGLRKLGYRVRVVEGAELAERLLAQGVVSFVFLDQASLGERMMPLARALSERRRAPGGLPHLAVVARHGSVFDRMRARMTGCAWMTVPLQRERLVAYFAHRGLIPHH